MHNVMYYVRHRPWSVCFGGRNHVIFSIVHSTREDYFVCWRGPRQYNVSIMHINDLYSGEIQMLHKMQVEITNSAVDG